MDIFSCMKAYTTNPGYWQDLSTFQRIENLVSCTYQTEMMSGQNTAVRVVLFLSSPKARHWRGKANTGHEGEKGTDDR